MDANKPSRQQGFILAATLWTLAIMFVVVGIFHTYVQRKLAVGTAAKANLEYRLNTYSTKNTLLYLLSSSRMTRAGLTFAERAEHEFRDEEGNTNTDAVGDEMLLDGTAYRGIDIVQFSVQDTSGLVSVNVQSSGHFSTLLEQNEPDPAERTRLLSALQDYIDANDVLSLSGAEAGDYSLNDLPLPTNDYLRSELELMRVFGWNAWLKTHPAFRAKDWLSLGRNPALNLNTMPIDLLKNYFAFSEEQVVQLIKERKANPFWSVDDFSTRLNYSTKLEEVKYRFFPGNEYRLMLWGRGGQSEVINLQLTPNGLYGPWLVNYEYSVERGEENNEALALPQTTLFGKALGDHH
jgi:general secretion pathway protein K